jgi:hypothetical protein
MNGSFVESLVANMVVPQTRTVNGKERLLNPAGWSDATPKIPSPTALVVSTLTGFVDYCKANVDGLLLHELLVQVVDQTRVELRAKLNDEAQEFRRMTLLAATTDLYGKALASFGQFWDAEVFTIWLQSGFVPTPERDEILTLIASIKESDVRETVDNGVSQEVKTAGGVVLVGRSKVPNPVTLQPFRTFREVEQPASRFILRLKSGKEGEKPSCGLIEADGGSWRLEAIQRIGAYLRDHLGESPLVIA